MGKRILVVEDEPETAEILQRLLERRGYQVSVSMNGKEALEKINKDPPDLVVLDLNLPKLPGEEVCKEIRKDEKLKDIPVVMLTGKSSDTDKVIGKVIGADFYLTKPIEVDNLLRVVGDILGKVQ